MSDLNGQDDPNITRFPDEKHRDLLRRQKEESALRQKEPSEPILNIPPVTKYLSAAMIAVFLAEKFLTHALSDDQWYALAFVPARYAGDLPFDASALTSLFTHMFLHGGWLHLAINIGTLLAFGAGLEKMMGGRKLLLLFFVTGILGAFTHAAFYIHLQSPLIGASGGISGLFGGVLMMMHMNGVMGHGYKKLIPFAGVWIGISLFFGLFGVPGTDNPIAWTTHVGGFLAGLFLFKPILRMKIQH